MTPDRPNFVVRRSRALGSLIGRFTSGWARIPARHYALLRGPAAKVPAPARR